jgi:formate hydrogenlyase regulatory protein HycA
MAIPQVIPIAHEPDGRTATVGHYADGQFLASVTYAYPAGYLPDDGWEQHRRLYAVLHTFDADGVHRDTEVWCGGTWADQQRDPAVLGLAGAHLTKLLETLPSRAYGDIAVRPFRRVLDGVLFGLLVESEEEGDEWAELHPDRLGFGPPWDGAHDA